MKKELLELSLAFTDLEKKFKKVKADNNSPTPDDCMDTMWSLFSNIHARIDRVVGAMYDYQDNHQKGHLPPITGPDKMTKAIKTLGMEGDYSVMKPTIYASKIIAGRLGKTLEVDIQK